MPPGFHARSREPSEGRPPAVPAADTCSSGCPASHARFAVLSRVDVLLAGTGHGKAERSPYVRAFPVSKLPLVRAGVAGEGTTGQSMADVPWRQ